MPVSVVDARDRLIVALDVADTEAACKLVADLGDTITFYKIGLSLQLASGVRTLIDDLIKEGKKVFLDYKYYDIPKTLERAVGRAAEIGVSFLTVHGTSNLIHAAVKGRGDSSLKLFTVTVLTSMDLDDIREMGYGNPSVEDLVIHRSVVALTAGCDGVIASGREARKIKRITEGKLLVATPGIRDEEDVQGDQKRSVTAREAVAAGADYLVIGRPITEPKGVTSRKAAQRKLDEMQKAFDALHSE